MYLAATCKTYKRLRETPWRCPCNNCTIHKQLPQRLQIATCLLAQLQKIKYLPVSSAQKPNRIAPPVGTQWHPTKNIQHCYDLVTNSCTKLVDFLCSGCVHTLARCGSCWCHCWFWYCYNQLLLPIFSMCDFNALVLCPSVACTLSWPTYCTTSSFLCALCYDYPTIN